MHVAESVGLHQNFSTLDKLYVRSFESAQIECSARRKTFWLAVSLNKLFSIEYGRSPIRLDSINCIALKADELSDSPSDLVKLSELVPYNLSGAGEPGEEARGLVRNLAVISELKLTSKAPIALLKADVCFSIFRKARFLRMTMAKTQAEAILDIIRVGLLEAQSLAYAGSKWWNTVSVPFHSVAILLAIGSTESLSLLPSAVDALKTVVNVLDTHLAREAMETAQKLVRGYHEKKMQEVRSVNQALAASGGEDSEAVCSVGQDMPFDFPQLQNWIDWPIDDDGAWLEVLFNTNTEQ